MKILIDKDELKKLYIIQQKSSRQIAKELNVSQTTILNRLKQFNIPKKMIARYKISLDDKEIKQLYNNKQLSLDEIGKMFNVSRGTIGRRLREMGIICRGSENRLGKYKQEFRDDINTNDIIKLYQEGYSTNELAEKYNCSNNTIYYRLKKANVKIRPNKSGRKLAYREEIKTSKKWTEFSLYLRNKRGNICQVCKKNKKKLNCHHIKDVRDYPELKYDKNNIIVTCNKCHSKDHFGVINAEEHL